MRLLFDHNVPAPLRPLLTGHAIALAGELGWHDLENGALLMAAEQARFDLLLTADQNIRYQQNLSNRTIALVVLSSNAWPDIQPHVAAIQQAISQVGKGGYLQLELPRRQLIRRPRPTQQD